MKTPIHAALVSILLVSSAAAFAQGTAGGSAGGGTAGQGGSNGSGNSNGPGAATAPAPMASAPSTHKKAMKHHKMSNKKSATDTTNMPGADASSDTKGQ